MEMKFIVEAQGSSEGQPLRIVVSGGRLEVLGFSPGKKVAIEEAYGRLTISLLEVFEEAQPVPAPVVPSVPVVAPVQSVPVQPLRSEVVGQPALVQSAPAGQSLFQQLVALRKQIAVESGVPPFIIFHDATLKEMSLSLPSSLEALNAIQGVGKAKLVKYGERFLSLIRHHAASRAEGVA